MLGCGPQLLGELSALCGLALGVGAQLLCESVVLIGALPLHCFNAYTHLF